MAITKLMTFIAPELVLFTNLRTLICRATYFMVPYLHFWLFATFQRLWSYSNNLSGPIPIEISLTNELRACLLEEELWREQLILRLENLVNLQYLFIYSSEISGPIPASIGNLHQLVLLDLYNNLLDGSIPPELGNLSNLVRLVLARICFR